MVLRHHDSWRDWFDSELVVGLVGLVALVVTLLGLGLDDPARVLVVGLGLVVLVPVVVLLALPYVLLAWYAVRFVALALSPAGRSRLRERAAAARASFGEARDGWRAPRAQVVPLGPVELGLRARLRLHTPRGDVVLSAARCHRGRLEAVAWALHGR